jgi:hypothetical protein
MGDRGDSTADQSTIEIELRPRSDHLDEGDPRFREQVGNFIRELRAVAPVRTHSTPVAGTKGGVDTISVVLGALGSAGTFTAVEHMFRSWLNRDRGRSLEVRLTKGDPSRVTLKGGSLDDDLKELQALLKLSR